MSHPVLTEKDLEFIFSDQKKRKKKKELWKKIILSIAFFILVTVLVFIFMNASTLRKNFTYWYNTQYKSDDSNKNNVLASITPSNCESAKNMPQIPNNSISIPAINTSAPISWQIENKPDIVAFGLQNGLIHIKGTALPGEIGNVFITGHSSNYPWAKGDYNNVFALLNKLVVGDMVQVKYQNKDYVYKVSELKVVEPSETSVLKSRNSSELTLMTCTPVGTSLRRLIITSKQVFPDPQKNLPRGDKNIDNSLPNVH